MKHPLQETFFELDEFTMLTARRVNIIRSPKQFGNSDDDSIPYLLELGKELTPSLQPIQFQQNTNEPIHRWSPYVQGFSAYFVQRTLDRYKSEYANPFILDPFAGSGTVLVQSKLNGYPSLGIEINPLLHFIASTKVGSWKISPYRLLELAQSIIKSENQDISKSSSAPSFLRSEKHFDAKVLNNLKRLKSSIEEIQFLREEDKLIKEMLLLAFASILIDCSKLKRSPCLGYCKTKQVDSNAPYRLFLSKVEQMVEDLSLLQIQYQNILDTQSTVILGNSNEIELSEEVDLIITSPPYMNGMDYVMNYKIEMGWLGFGESYSDLKRLKDNMVVCDNVSKGLVREFELSKRYTNPWIEQIKIEIKNRILNRGNYRRTDMPEIVHKYFDDMYKVIRNIVQYLRINGRLIMVVGDSLIADTYIPTDLILARIGEELGLRIELLEKARERRSGQIRSYRLRETIITLRKDK